MVPRGSRLLAAVLVLLAGHAAVRAQQPPLLLEGHDATYNLDYPRAFDLYTRILASDPDNAAAHRAMATLAWLQVLFVRGTVTVDDYLGDVSSSDVALPPPRSDLAAAFHRHVQRAEAIGARAVARRSGDASAHYDLGAALGLLASYTGSVDGKLFPAFRAARRAYNEHERALELDPGRKDAGLVVGTYRYVVSTLPAAIRWMAYLVGFGGGKEHGIRLLEEAAAHPSESQTDARFALVLVYNRERRYDDALRMVRGLERSYPRNRLLWLEEGATGLRAGKALEAAQALEEGLRRMQADPRPRMPGEEALWRCKLGTARVLLNDLATAEADLRAVLADREARGWVRGRAHVELGKIADLAGDRERAKREYRAGLALAERSNDPPAAREARRLVNRAYRPPPPPGAR